MSSPTSNRLKKTLTGWLTLAGRKRWALYPPHVTPPGVHVQLLDDDEGEPSGVHINSLTSLQVLASARCWWYCVRVGQRSMHGLGA